MQHLKIFQVDQSGDTLLITPFGEGSAFRYQDLQLEVNVIRGAMMRHGIKNLIINLGQMNYFGSEFIGALVSLLRESRARGGKASFCNAQPQTLDVLKGMSLFTIWPHYDKQEEAFAFINAAKAAQVAR